MGGLARADEPVAWVREGDPERDPVRRRCLRTRLQVAAKETADEVQAMDAAHLLNTDVGEFATASLRDTTSIATRAHREDLHGEAG